MSLYFQKTGTQGPVIVILHGLFGSHKNWRSIAKILSRQFQVYNLDLRNHGASIKSDEMNYPLLAQDIHQFIVQHHLSPVYIIAHSMGGKAAMYLALCMPDIDIAAMLIVDIAPICYTHRFKIIFKALSQVPLDKIRDRKQAHDYLVQYLHEPALTDFFLLNLSLRPKPHWTFHLPVLQGNIASIACFPELSDRQFPGKVMFVRGAQSDYIDARGRSAIKQFFPRARIITVKNAGHWLHAQQREVLLQIIRHFFHNKSH